MGQFAIMRVCQPSQPLATLDQLVWLLFYLVSLGLSILSKFKNPKLKEFWYESDWRPEDETDLEEPFAFLRKFQGLETLVLQVPAQRCPANCLKNLTELRLILSHLSTIAL